MTPRTTRTTPTEFRREAFWAHVAHARVLGHSYVPIGALLDPRDGACSVRVFWRVCDWKPEY